MVSVYLDQQNWIARLKAESGHPDGAPFVETLAELRARLVKTSFDPLSSVHYIELHKIADAGKRGALGALMFDLSRALTILSYARLLPMDSTARSRRLSAARWKSARLRLFGLGVSHACAIAPPTPYSIPATRRRGDRAGRRRGIPRGGWTPMA